MTTPATESRPRFLRVVIAVWLVLVSTIALVDHVALSQLSAEVRPYGSEVSILYERVLELDRQVDGVASQPAAVSEERFDEARQGWEARIAQLEQAVGNAAPRDELAPVQDRLNAVETRLANLRQTRPAPASRAPSPPETAPKATPEIIVPPFAVLGIESRGGEPFLSIAPTGANTLGQVHVLRVGETYSDWRVEKLNGTTAEFRVADRLVRIELPKKNET